MLVADFTLSPEEYAEFTAPPPVVVVEKSATASPSSDLLLRRLIDGTAQHQSVMDSNDKLLLKAAEILEASKSLGIDESHERYAARILQKSRQMSNSVKL